RRLNTGRKNLRLFHHPGRTGRTQFGGTTKVIQGWHPRLNLTLIALAALAGCAGAPERAAEPQVVQVDTSPVHPTISEPVPVEVPPEAEVVAEAAPEPEPVGDLLDRVRAGLALGTHYHSRIDKEADWFARNPEYIERVFQRAAPYLHYIVEEVERREIGRAHV